MFDAFFETIPSVSATVASQKVGNAGAAFIDVRTPGEYASGHAEGAQNIPLDTIDEKATTPLKKFSEVYVICRSGARSRTAASLLRKAHVNAINVEGGTNAWRKCDLPTT